MCIRCGSVPDVDTIDTLEVGKIYQIYVDSDCTLEYGIQSYELYGPDWNFIYWLGTWRT